MLFLPDEIAEKLKLTQEKEEALRSTVINQQGPGTILTDFQAFLSFVDEAPVLLTPKHMLSMSVLAPLNERMTRPLQHGLRRPQQKAFPHINGLYLLMRASGLTYVDVTGKKPVLMIDAEVFDTWNRLNPTERYFSLWETWLLRASPDIIDENSSMAYYTHPTNWRALSLSISGKDLKSTSGISLTEGLTLLMPQYNLAMMELFGLVSVDTGIPMERTGWQIDGIRHTTFGNGLLALVTTYMHDIENLARLALFNTIPCGTLQPQIQPYFPEWQNNLITSQNQFREGIFVFKAALKKTLWRRLAIPADCTLDELSVAILAAYDFDNDHLYEFIYPHRSGIPERTFHPSMDEGPWADEVLIGELPIQRGSSMVYHFDFDDDWRFEVTLEKIDVENETIKEPTMLEQHGEAPEQYPSYEDGWE